jgi:hypothetical protein
MHSSIKSAAGWSGAAGVRQRIVARLAWAIAGLLLSALAGCGARAPHSDTLARPNHLPEQKVQRLLRAWEQQLAQYVAQEGGGDLAALSQMRVIHARDALRPARITFSALDVDAIAPGRDGWDVDGVLVGKQTDSNRSWYVFVVGLVGRDGYRPAALDDMRIVAVSSQDGKLTWQVSEPSPRAVHRYRMTSGNAIPVKFPGDTDHFSMASGPDECVHVAESQSQSEWSLRLGKAKPGAAGDAPACVDSASIL